jgi:hypothetical protein
MSALLFVSRVSVLSRRCVLPSSSIFRAAIVAAQPKSTYQYEYDKSSWQKYIEGRTKRVQQLQKLWSADPSTSIWWKTTGDKVYVIVVAVVLSWGLISTLSNIYLLAYGKL